MHFPQGVTQLSPGHELHTSASLSPTSSLGSMCCKRVFQRLDAHVTLLLSLGIDVNILTTIPTCNMQQVGAFSLNCCQPARGNSLPASM